jgi:hypothetical protein
MINYYLSVFVDKIFLSVGNLLNNQLRIKSGDTPIFIVSAGRSGSTLLRKLLIQTGYFNIPPESGDFLPSAAKIYIKNMFKPWRIKKKKILELIASTPELKIWNLNTNKIKDTYDSIHDRGRNLGSMIRLLYNEYATERDLPDSKFWGDKTPYLIYRLAWLKLIFPNAKIIHMVRDPRAVMVSRKREFNDSIDYSIKRWKWGVKCISNAKNSQDILEIKFEDLILSTDVTMIKILKYVSGQLKYKKKYTKVILGDDHFKHHRNLNKPILKGKITEWEDFLSKEDKEYIEQMLSFEMGNYGYKI